MLLFLKNHKRIAVQIAHVNRGALDLNIRMLFDHQPTHVCEEHAARHIMRIGIRVGELVVDP